LTWNHGFASRPIAATAAVVLLLLSGYFLYDSEEGRVFEEILEWDRAEHTAG